MPHFVYNIDGTSSRKCQCSTIPKTWLGHWERGTGLALPVKCVAKYCGNVTEVGAHVRDDDDKRIVWIVPFCQYHNKRPSSEPIELKDAVTLCGGSMTIDCA
ncbi:hypothetical protein ACPA5B_13875 [Pseudomonas solani]|uniref:hypothetical protein n=1 Tax=Pseudomonas solani TaxID=2731552 RepID=UPI003C2CF4B2